VAVESFFYNARGAREISERTSLASKRVKARLLFEMVER